MSTQTTHQPLGSNSGLGAQERITRYREAIDTLFPAMQIIPARGVEQRFSVRTARHAGVQVTSMAGSAHSVERRPGRRPAAEFSQYKIGLHLAGTATLVQGDKEATMGPGGLALCDISRDYDLHLTGDYHFIVIQFSKDLLPLPSGIVDELSAERFAASSELDTQLARYLQTLGENLPLLSSPAGAGLVRGFLDLAGAAVGAQLDVPRAGGMHAPSATLMQILVYIDEHLADSALTPSSIADAHFLSLRHLYNLFASSGYSVAQWIRKRRLESVRTDLENPAFAGQTVLAVAQRWGFEDPSHFSRIFKERYGATPGAWRARALALGAAV